MRLVVEYIVFCAAHVGVSEGINFLGFSGLSKFSKSNAFLVASSNCPSGAACPPALPERRELHRRVRPVSWFWLGIHLLQQSKLFLKHEARPGNHDQGFWAYATARVCWDEEVRHRFQGCGWDLIAFCRMFLEGIQLV